MALFKLQFLFVMLFVVVRSWLLPVEKCRLDDSKCMVKAFQKVVPIFFEGIPELGMKNIDQLDDITADLSGLKFTVSNGRIEGLKNNIVDSVNWNLKKKYIDLEYHVACVLKGNYTATGKIFIMPINGEGEIKVKLDNIAMKLRIHYDIVKLADDKNHVRPKKYSFQYDVKDHADYYATDLFKGNKELSENILKFINENWQDVTNVFGKPLIENLTNNIYKNIESFFAKVSIDDMAIV